MTLHGPERTQNQHGRLEENLTNEPHPPFPSFKIAPTSLPLTSMCVAKVSLPFGNALGASLGPCHPWQNFKSAHSITLHFVKENLTNQPHPPFQSFKIVPTCLPLTWICVDKVSFSFGNNFRAPKPGKCAAREIRLSFYSLSLSFRPGENLNPNGAWDIPKSGALSVKWFREAFHARLFLAKVMLQRLGWVPFPYPKDSSSYHSLILYGLWRIN